MSEMVERVAVAMVERFQRIDFEERQRENAFRTLARAAIEAMREPTEAMIHSVDVQNYEQGERMHCDQAWSAMVDAALAEGTEAATTPS